MELIQLHLKSQKNLKNKKFTEKGEYYFAKGFKVLLSCAKNNRSTLITIQIRHFPYRQMADTDISADTHTVPQCFEILGYE